MSQEIPHHLHAQILADPGDDAPRLVYADWLSDHGDSARADLIRTQVARASTPPWDERQVSLELAERALLSEHEARFRADLPALEGITWGRFRRGFVEQVACDGAEALARHASDLGQIVPLVGLAMRWPAGAEWMRLAPIGTLRELTLYGRLFGRTDAEGFALSSFPSTLRALNLLESGMRREVLRSLLPSKSLRGLTALRIPYHSLSTASDLTLAKRSSPLTELDLSVPRAEELGSGGRDSPGLRPADMQAFAGWADLSHVHTLALSGNIIGPGGLATLLSSPHISGLKHLDIRAITEQETLSFSGLVQANPQLSLESLSLQCGLSRSGARQLAKAACLSDLKVLRLENMIEAEDGAYAALAEAPWLDQVRVIEADYANASGLLSALASRPLAHLHTLHLRTSLDWSLSHDLVSAFVSAKASDNLLALDLSFNRLEERTIDTIAAASGLRRLLALRIRDRKIDRKAVAERLARSALGARLLSLELGTKGDRAPLPALPRLPLRGYQGPLAEL